MRVSSNFFPGAIDVPVLRNVVLAAVAGAGLAGCGGGLYKPIGPPPADTVTFPAASTQAWLVQNGTGAGTGYENQNGDKAEGVATDPQGNVIVLDRTYGAFSGFTNPRNTAQFAVLKYDPTGKLLWVQQFGTGAGDFPGAIATDAGGNIFVGGGTYGAFPGFTNSAGTLQPVVFKLNSSGQTQWIQQMSSSVPGKVQALATDSQGNAIAGENLQLGYGNTYGSVVKLAAANGTPLWTAGNSANGMVESVSGLAIDPQNNVIAVGNFAGAGTSSMASTQTYMVAKLNGTNGLTVWENAPASYSAYGGQLLIYTQVAVDAQGNVDLDGLDQSSGYNRCVAAQLANGSGTQQWQQEFGAAQNCVPGGIATDATGDAVMTGVMESPFFPSSNPPQTDDVFLARWTQTGSAVWLQQFGTGDELGGNNASAPVFVATDSQNRADVAGTTLGAFPNFTNPNNVKELFLAQYGQ